MFTLLAIPLLYMIGAFTTFRVWMHRSPPIYVKDGRNLKEKYWVENVKGDNKRDEWYIKGWDRVLRPKYTKPDYYRTMNHAIANCLVAWWIIDIVVLAKLSFFGIKHVFVNGANIFTPMKYKTDPTLEPPKPVDPYEAIGENEVQKLLSA